jgi:hypothetical protein
MGVNETEGDSMQALAETSEEVVLSPEYSARGDNAYYIAGCAVVGHAPAYASCLNKIKRVAERTCPSIYSDCKSTINGQGCAATRMQRHEKAEGRALYYVSRAALNAANDARDDAAGERHRNGLQEISTRAKKGRRTAFAPPLPRTPVASSDSTSLEQSIERSVETDYSAALAQALTRAAKIETASVAKPPPVLSSTTAGESALEVARRMLAAKSK